MLDELSSCFRGRSILVTGAGGSIGSVLCHRIVSEHAARLVMLSLTESALYHIDRALRHRHGKHCETDLLPVLGSAGDQSLLEDLLPGIDIVIHAAAHKHVPLCEMNPAAAIENNVGSTVALAEACARSGVGQLVLVSSDKAVNPASVMGATKRLSELVIRDLVDHDRTRAFTVRFGNVMDSAGSVLPLWREQIAAGGPVTITDPRCERYLMTIDDAVGLIASTISLAPSSGTFVFDMGPPQRLIDIARSMIAQSGRDIAIETIGLRPGEKLTEDLSFGGTLVPTGIPRVCRVEEMVSRPLDAVEVKRLLLDARLRNIADALERLWRIIG